MAKILAVYGTAHGQTKAIVERLGKALGWFGHEVSIWQGDHLPFDYSLEEFDAFVLAGSVHFGRHQHYLRGFARRHATRLNHAPSAFVSVCGALAGSWPKGENEARKYLERFIAETGWAPSASRSMAGAIKYTCYRWPVRMIIRAVSARTGRPTDTSRDWDFTDWEGVDRFGAELAGRFAGSIAGLEAPPRL